VSSPRVTLIVAATEREVIGDRNDLPWHLRPDLQRFKTLTMGHTVVMGRLTHESILARLGKPMPGRRVVLVTTGDGAGLPHASSVPDALSLARDLELSHSAEPTRSPEPARSPEATRSPEAASAGETAREPEVFVGGGAQVYVAALPFVDRILLTRVHADIPGDTALPAGWLTGFHEVASVPGPAVADGPAYTWLTYERD
jgi:dihydrofolate reductase